MDHRPDTDDKICMAEIAIYAIFLGCGIYLCTKHGFGRGSGWLYIVIMSLARIIGSGMRLGTINDPTNSSLLAGWLVLNGLGLSILILAMLGLVTRLFESLERQGQPVKPVYQRLISLLMLVAMILQIVGGSNATAQHDGSTISLKYPTTSKAGLGLTIAILVLTGIEIFYLILNQGYVAQGEHRIYIAILASLPFILARLGYSCALIFGSIIPSPWLTLGLSTIMEMIVVLIYVITGFSLDKAPPKPAPKAEDVEMGNGTGGRRSQRPPRTLIGYAKQAYDNRQGGANRQYNGGYETGYVSRN